MGPAERLAFGSIKPSLAGWGPPSPRPDPGTSASVRALSNDASGCAHAAVQTSKTEASVLATAAVHEKNLPCLDTADTRLCPRTTDEHIDTASDLRKEHGGSTPHSNSV